MSFLPTTLPFGARWPRISIVTPSLNQGDFIEETILSVCNQNYPDVEHIVVDGGSRDGTNAVLDRHRDHLARIISEPDRGQSHAINKGMALATGDILTWLNSDDQLAPGALAGIAMAFHTSGADLVAGICELWRDGRMIDRHLTSCADGGLPLEELLDLNIWNAGQFFFQPEVMFTREIWRRAGSRVSEDLYYSLDYDLWLRFAAAGARLKVIGRPVAQFRMHAGQKTAEPSRFQAELPEARRKFLETHESSYSERPHETPPPKLARIAFVNDIGPKWGAGIAHQRLAESAARAGHEVASFACAPDVLKQVEGFRPDLVLVGNLHAAGVSASFLQAIADVWPTAFVMHDLWIVTGRCAYTGGCNKLRSRCDESCPTPNEYPALSPELIGPAWDAKRDLLTSGRAPVLLANSEWTRLQARCALGESDQIAVESITLGVPEDFTPLPKQSCRRLLGLPQDAFLVLFSATTVSDPRKGWAHLAQAVDHLDLPDLQLVLLGQGTPGPIQAIQTQTHQFLHLTDPKTLAMVYCAADVVVGPSAEECLGQVFLEAAACGVPTIGYAVGGVPEAVKDGVTGLLSSEATPEALATTIRHVYEDHDLRKALSVWARIDSENSRTPELSYHRMHAVLRRVLPKGRELFGPKISFPVSRSAYAQEESDRWEALTGFGPWEGPYADLNLSRCRWLENRRGSFHVRVHAPGRQTLVLRLRNMARNQKLRICCGESIVFDGPAPVASEAKDWELKLNVDFAAARNLITVEASSSITSLEGRSLVVLFCDVQVLPAVARRRLSLFARLFAR